MAESTRCLQCTCEAIGFCDLRRLGIEYGTTLQTLEPQYHQGAGYRSVTENRFTGINHDYVRDDSHAFILRERSHPEQGFRACIGILRHAKGFGRDRLEAACGRALEIGARSYPSLTSILKSNLDRNPPAPATDGPAIAHDNIRGPGYFH